LKSTTSVQCSAVNKGRSLKLVTMRKEQYYSNLKKGTSNTNKYNLRAYFNASFLVLNILITNILDKASACR
jgi:hypothetical protein